MAKKIMTGPDEAPTKKGYKTRSSLREFRTKKKPIRKRGRNK